MKKAELDNFARRPAPAAPVDEPKTGKAPRGTAKRVSIAVRVSPDDWAELGAFAYSQHKSLNALLIEGIQMLMASKNVKPITGK